MADFIQETFGVRSPASTVIITIALMLFCGFAMTRLTKLLKLPNVTAYILTGILLGPFCLDAVPETVLNGTEFLSDIALAFIAFCTGEFFEINVLKKNGSSVVIITAAEALTASLLVFTVLYFLLKVNLAFSVILASLAAATASASTMMTIRQTGAKGEFVNTLLQVVALDNVISLIAYSVSISVAVAVIGGANALNPSDVFVPLLANAAVFLLGGAFGFFLTSLLKKRSKDNRLIVSVAVLFAFCGVCAVMNVSPLLGCMSMATVYVNVSGDKKLFKQLNYFSPPILLLFFVRSGVGFDLSALFDFSHSPSGVSLPAVGTVYFFARITGKFAGAYLGCKITKKTKNICNNLGFALIPQAGVSIGLAALGARTVGGETGQALQTVILASGVLYELFGPALAKLSLHLSGSYSRTQDKAMPVKIITCEKHFTEEDEQAFSDAAEEQYRTLNDLQNIYTKKRKTDDMIRFECDYTDGCAPRVLQALNETNSLNTVGYGNDEFCKRAKEKIKEACMCPEAEVHFAVGGTQANTIIISSVLRPYEGVVCCESGHINVHETGAVEATGHKVLALPAVDGKLTARGLEKYLSVPTNEHEVKPGMVYISQPTETGTLYSAKELEEIYAVCKKHSVPLFADGARLAYALGADANDVSLPFLAKNCDIFYIGGTKCGALFGEAMVFTDPDLAYNIRHMIKRHGALLAKGRLLGVQFEALFTDDLYAELGKRATALAEKVKEGLKEAGVELYYDSPTNQIFPVFENEVLEKLQKTYSFEFIADLGDKKAMRICTGWSTEEEHVDMLIKDIKEAV